MTHRKKHGYAVWGVMCYVAIVTKIIGMYVAMGLISCYSLCCNVCIWRETVTFFPAIYPVHRMVHIKY